MLVPDTEYDRIYAGFRWTLPERYNIGVDVCDRWAAIDPSRIAIFDVKADGTNRPLPIRQ